MSHKIEVERSDRIDGIKVITWTHPMECSVTHLTWTQYDEIVAGAEKLRQSFDVGTTEQDRAGMARDDEEYHELCGHFHSDHGEEHDCPLAPCGDYRCCIN